MTLKASADEIARQLGVSPPWLHLPVRPMMLIAHATEIVCKPFGIEPPIFRRRVSFFLKNRAFDISKARRMLGFEPSQDFPGEIADIIADYRARGLLPQVVAGSGVPSARVDRSQARGTARPGSIRR